MERGFMKTNNPSNQPTASNNHIPEVNIIDLEHDGNTTECEQIEAVSFQNTSKGKKSVKKNTLPR